MNRKSLLVIVTAWLVFFPLRCNVFAEFRFGNFTIYPEIGMAETYRSNIYQTEWNVKSDFITSILPGIRTQYIFGHEHSLDLGYSGSGKYYADYSENNYWTNTAWGNLNLRFPGGLDLGVAQKYINDWLERSAFIPYQRHYIENVTGALAAYKFADRWKAQLQYTRDDYAMSATRDELNNYISNLFGGSMFYRFTPRTSGLIEYQYITKNYDKNYAADSKVDQFFLGINFDPAGKLRGEFKLGYGWKDFDQNLSGRKDKTDTWVAYGNVVQNFTKYTSLGLLGSRAFKDDGDYGNTPYYSTIVALTLQHYFMTKIGGTAMVGYDLAEYQEETGEPITRIFKKRTDNAYSTGIGAFYDIQKYLKARLDYNYIKRDSNFYGYSFNENRVMFRIVYSP